MLAIEVAVGIHHLRLDPDAEVHAELMDAIDDRLETVGKFFFINVPVAESGVIVLALAEPSVVDDKALDAEGSGLFSKRKLAGFADPELGGLPRVIEDGTEFGMRGAGQDHALLETMKDAGGFAHAAIGEAPVKWRSAERLAGGESVAEVEGIVTTGDTNL